MDARRRKTLTLAAALLCAVAGASRHAAAQTGAREALAAFPDAQAVMYFDTRRIMTEALPRVVPPAELEKMFADASRNPLNFDPRSVHFFAVGARYREPVSAQTRPDILVMVKGDFNAEALLVAGRTFAGQGHTTETYKGRTLDLFDMAKISAQGRPPGAPPPPPPAPGAYNELAVVVLDAGTVVAGVPSYVRAAVDAAEGQGRLRADLLDLVARNPDNLASLAGDIPASLFDLLKASGMPANPEVEKIARSLRQLQVSVQMTASDFGSQTIVRTDTAENAAAINGLVALGLGFARMGLEEELRKVPADKPAEREAMQAVLDTIGNLRNEAHDNEVQLSLTVPQATVAELVRKARAEREKKQQAAPAGKRTRTRTGPRRRTPRRRG